MERSPRVPRKVRSNIAVSCRLQSWMLAWTYRRMPARPMSRDLHPETSQAGTNESTAHQSETLSGCMGPEFVVALISFASAAVRYRPTSVRCPRLLGSPKRTSTPALCRQGEPPAARHSSSVARHTALEIGRRPQRWQGSIGGACERPVKRVPPTDPADDQCHRDAKQQHECA